MSTQPYSMPSVPIHLTASTTLASNTTGGVNSVALKNPTGAPMLIQEIKFQLIGPNVNDGSNVFGGIIAAKLDLGNNPLTNGYVPVWNFGRSLAFGSEEFAGSDIVNSISEFAWKLPRPLYVPAGGVVVPSFQHRGLITDSITARISYAGRSLTSRGVAPPKTIYVPYVSAYISKNFAFNSADTDQSTETDIVNPFPDPLRIARFTGRCQFYLSSGDPVPFATETSIGTHTAGSESITVRMVDSNGRPIIRNFTVFRAAFPGPTRSWELNGQAIMDPSSYYKVFLRKAAPLAGSSPSTADAAQAFIGCVGWREIGESAL